MRYVALQVTMAKRKKLKKIVDKYIEETQTTDIQKEQEFKKRRDSRKERKRAIHRDKLLKFYRFLYLPTLFCWVAGFILTMGSVIRRLGEKTILWTYRHVFSILGPVLLGCGFILLMLSVGLVTNRRDYVKKSIRLSRQSSISSKTSTKRSKSVQSTSNSIESSQCHSIEELNDSRPLVLSRVSSSSSFQPDFGASLSSSRFSRQSSTSSRVSFKEEVSVCDIISTSEKYKRDVDTSRVRRVARSLLKFQELNKKFKRNMGDEIVESTCFLKGSIPSLDDSNNVSENKIQIINEVDEHRPLSTETITLNGNVLNYYQMDVIKTNQQAISSNLVCAEDHVGEHSAGCKTGTNAIQ